MTAAASTLRRSRPGGARGVVRQRRAAPMPTWRKSWRDGESGSRWRRRASTSTSDASAPHERLPGPRGCRSAARSRARPRRRRAAGASGSARPCGGSGRRGPRRGPRARRGRADRRPATRRTPTSARRSASRGPAGAGRSPAWPGSGMQPPAAVGVQADVVRLVQPVAGRHPVEVGPDRLERRVGHGGRSRSGQRSRPGTWRGFSPRKLRLTSGKPRSTSSKKWREYSGWKAQRSGRKVSNSKPGVDEVAADADLVLVDDQLLVAPAGDGVEPEAEAGVVEDRTPEHQEVGARGAGSGRRSSGAGRGSGAWPRRAGSGRRRRRTSRRAPSRSPAGSTSRTRGRPSRRTRRRAGAAGSSCRWRGRPRRSRRAAPSRRGRAPAARTSRSRRRRAGRSTPRPRALEPVELAGLEHPVGEVEDVGVPGQLAAGSPRRSRRRGRRGRSRRTGRPGGGACPRRSDVGVRSAAGSGSGLEPVVAPDEQVVQQRVDLLVGRVEVAGPVGPQVEAQAGRAQAAPALLDEVADRVGAASQPVLAAYSSASRKPLAATTARARRPAPAAGGGCGVAVGRRGQARRPGPSTRARPRRVRAVGRAPRADEAAPAPLEVGDRRAAPPRARASVRAVIGAGAGRRPRPRTPGVSRKWTSGLTRSSRTLGVVDEVLADVEVARWAAGTGGRGGAGSAAPGPRRADDVVVGAQVPGRRRTAGTRGPARAERPPPASPAAAALKSDTPLRPPAPRRAAGPSMRSRWASASDSCRRPSRPGRGRRGAGPPARPTPRPGGAAPRARPGRSPAPRSGARSPAARLPERVCVSLVWHLRDHIAPPPYRGVATRGALVVTMVVRRRPC